jgi:hypothetical protein
MSQGEIVILVLIGLVVLVAVAIWLTFRRRRSEKLRARYGDEYDRTVEVAGGRGPAEANLAAREKRVRELDIRPLAAGERQEFTAEWHEVKAVFVDSPAEAVLHADRMLTRMMQARGFPMGDFDRRYEDLTVHHADVARHYRAGNEIALRQNRGEATTEELRQAMKHYEALFDHMVSDVSDTVKTRPITAPATPRATA